jgi:hypothetical protein
VLGFPIRTSPDQRLVGDSPRLNAASHVLHRLLMPRHPPCALKNLATKMLASTMQISNNKQPTGNITPNIGMLTGPVRGPTDKQAHPATGRAHRGPFPQDPTVCPTRAHQPTRVPTPLSPAVVLAARTVQTWLSSQCSTNEPSRIRRSLMTVTWTRRPRGAVWSVLLRKEVIQPHLPVRLPCYDFVPIASPTFDRSPPYGLGHGLRVLPTFVT